jgi:hypothetical protein
VVVFGELPDDVPVIVTGTDPVVAVPVAVNVSVLVVVVELGLNDALTPLGRPEADKSTTPLKPFAGVRVIVAVPEFPCAMLTLPGDAERVKFTGAVTVRVIVVVLVTLPDVPVIVTKAVPVVAELLADSVSVLAVLAGFGPNDAVTPLGRPDADNVTPLLKPLYGVMLMVGVPGAPCAMLTLPGDAESVKPGAVEPQDGNLKDARRVLQLNEPVVSKYSFVYQKVQSSAASIAMLV